MNEFYSVIKRNIIDSHNLDISKAYAEWKKILKSFMCDSSMML